MNSVELVKQICKEREIPISKLERDCGFSNGYIRSLRRGSFPYEKMKTISNYLQVPMERLVTNEKSDEKQGWYLDDETAKAAQEVFDDPDTRMLFDAARNASPEAIRLAAEMLKTFKKTNPDG